MAKYGLDQIKIHLPADLKEKFANKVKKQGKSQTSVLKSYIHKYLNE